MTPGIEVVAVRTPTLPPATHTNTYVVGAGRLSVFDPASPWPEEQQRLSDALGRRLDRGETVERIVLTHHHADHVSGALDLRDRLRARGVDAPIAAHPVTAALLAPSLPVDEVWEGGTTLLCGGRSLKAHHTPGHAPGHLVFQDAESAAVIAGDMVAGIGTIALDPSEADLQDYLDSLERMRALAPSVLLPAHGPAMPRADAVLGFYVAHRNQRSEQIRTALELRGGATAVQLAPDIYPELPEHVYPLAALQITTHLRWLRAHGLAVQCGEGRWEHPG